MTRKEKSIIERLRDREGRGSSKFVNVATGKPAKEQQTVVYHVAPYPGVSKTEPYPHDVTILKGTPNEPVRTATPNRPGVMRGTNMADTKPRIWKSGGSQVEDK